MNDMRGTKMKFYDKHEPKNYSILMNQNQNNTDQTNDYFEHQAALQHYLRNQDYQNLKRSQTTGYLLSSNRKNSFTRTPQDLTKDNCVYKHTKKHRDNDYFFEGDFDLRKQDHVIKLAKQLILVNDKSPTSIKMKNITTLGRPVTDFLTLSQYQD